MLSKEEIDKATYSQLLTISRFAPCGVPQFQGELGEYFIKKMAEKRAADPDAAVAASKQVGWG